MSAARITFFERLYPSANMVLVGGERPLLIDTGFGSDIDETERLVRSSGTSPDRLSLIVNTHYHCDHVGGNHALQQRYHLPIAAHRWEAMLVNQRDREACSAEWLRQPIEHYTVERALADGDEIGSGGVVLRVLHTPGHTLGHIALYAAEEQVLICGDTFHRDDVAWIGVFREGAGALQRMMESLDRLATLPLRRAYSGHGPAIDDPVAALDAARRRYEKWLSAPEKVGWHACKRIFAYALMLHGGLSEDRIAPYLLGCAWFQDYSRCVFGRAPADFVDPLLKEMVRSRAAGWRAGRLVALSPFNAPPPRWSPTMTYPLEWPRAQS